MSDEDFKEKMYDTFNELKDLVVKSNSDNEKRFDKQDVMISDIQDQIKGNPDKDITGMRQKLRELQRIMVIPIFIDKLPKWVKWVFGVIILNAIPDLNGVGILSLCKYLLNLMKP